MLHPSPAWLNSIHGLYSEHHQWLCQWLRRKLGCHHQAADVAQDTFVRLLQAGELLGTLREPRAYLTTTASRILIDRARRSALESALLAALEQAPLPAAPSPEQILMAMQVLQGLVQMLDALPAKARQAFLMHYLDERSHADIATELRVSDRMVRKYLAQAWLQCYQLHAEQ